MVASVKRQLRSLRKRNIAASVVGIVVGDGTTQLGSIAIPFAGI